MQRADEAIAGVAAQVEAGQRASVQPSQLDGLVAALAEALAAKADDSALRTVADECAV